MCARGVMQQGKVNAWLRKGFRVTNENAIGGCNSPSHSILKFRFKFNILAIRIFGKIEIECR